MPRKKENKYKRHTDALREFLFGNKVYKILWTSLPAGNLGECSDPNAKQPKIRIDPYQNQKDFMDTVIHEVLHATNFNLSEDAVGETAADITLFLWKLGFRYVPESPVFRRNRKKGGEE